MFRFMSKNQKTTADKEIEDNTEAKEESLHSARELTNPYIAASTEKWPVLLAQIVIIFLITGCGAIGTGFVLGVVSTWRPFQHIQDLYLLMPVLLGLKGNVDTCLAARLSTQVNLGNLDKRSELIKQTVSNMALVQVQAIVGAIGVSVYSVALGAAVNRQWNAVHALMLAMAATTTISVICLFLDILLIALILASHRLNINPDNIVCPIAATVSDVVSLVAFSYLIKEVYIIHRTYWWIFIVVMIVFIVVVLPVSIYISLKSPETRTVLFTGWSAVFLALIFSGLSSLVLDIVVEHYQGYVLFQPVMNGSTGNLVAILLTRLSTMLQKSSPVGAFHPDATMIVAPQKVWFRGTPQAVCVRLLIMVGIPGQLLFVFTADYIYNKSSSLKPAFVLTYLLVSTVQMLLMLYIGHIMVHAMWKYKIDPDNAAIPFVNAISDFVGSSLLAAAFALLLLTNQEYLHDKFGKT